MISMQQKILKYIEDVITASQLEALDQKSCGNTGKVFAASGLSSKFEIGYSFQDSYFSATISGLAVEKLLDEVEIESTGSSYGLRSATVKNMKFVVQRDYKKFKFFSVAYNNARDLTEFMSLVEILAKRSRVKNNAA